MSDNTKFYCGYRRTGSVIFCWWECEMDHLLCQTFWHFLITLNIQLLSGCKHSCSMISNSIPRYIFLKTSVVQSCPTLCDPTDCSTPGLPVNHQLPEFTQTPAHWVGDALQPSHPLSSPAPPAFNLSQHQGLFKWVSSSHQVAKGLEFQLQHQSFQWTFRTDFL